MSRKNKKFAQLVKLYEEERYNDLIDETKLFLAKEKNRLYRRKAQELMGMAFLVLDEHDNAVEYLRKACSHLCLKDFYAPFIKHYKAQNAQFNLFKCYNILIKHYPNDPEILEFLASYYNLVGNVDRAMYHAVDTQNWPLLARLCRKLVFWEPLEKLNELILTSIREDSLTEQPLSLLFDNMFIPSFTQQDSYNLAKKIVLPAWKALGFEKTAPLVEGFERKFPGKRSSRLKIGYISSDFYEHATMLLLARILELHDNTKFEIHLFIANEKLNDSYSKRIENMDAYKHYVYGKASEDLALLIKNLNIDILVDLKGYTANTTCHVSLYRPAPIIVNWLGYPSTLGVPEMGDYIITDKIITPLEYAPFFSETLAYMPHCYQPNDNSLSYDTSLTRADVGLPEDGIVFCSFNKYDKLNSYQMDFWCFLLRNIENSVIWLPEPFSKTAKNNFLAQAQKRGLKADRFIFAEKLPILEHRKRLQLADIGLDSFPMTSHTTASDLMAACVPLIAQIGNSFWSRVSASIVSANNCPQLVAYNIKEAYNLAYNLANNKELLAGVKAQMRENLKTAPLYNSELFTRNLERLYEKMWQQYETGKKEIIILE